jgi:hypothetical protein
MSRLLLAPLGLMTGLALLIGWELANPPPDDPAPAPRHVADARPAAATGEPDNDAMLSAWSATTLERPLFREDRRPQQVAADPGLVQGRPRLTGIIVGPFGRHALFTLGEGTKPVVVREGDRVGTLLIRSIQPGRAVVENGGKEDSLLLSFREAPARPGRSRAERDQNTRLDPRVR